MTWLAIAAAYALAVNIWLFGMMGLDKKRAAAGRRRVPERRLFAAAWLGGAAGGWAAMRLWRHKTKHRAFAYGLPLLAVLQLALLLYGAGSVLADK